MPKSNKTTVKPPVGDETLVPSELVAEAVSISDEAKRDLDNFEHVVRIKIDSEITAKDGTQTKVLVVNTRPEGFYALYNRFGNPIEYLAPDSEDLKAYKLAIKTGDVDWIMNNPYEYNELGYRVHTGRMIVYKDAMSNIKLTEDNLHAIGQAAISALEGQVLSFFYLSRVSGLKNLLGQGDKKRSSRLTTEIASL